MLVQDVGINPVGLFQNVSKLFVSDELPTTPPPSTAPLPGSDGLPSSPPTATVPYDDYGLLLPEPAREPTADPDAVSQPSSAPPAGSSNERLPGASGNSTDQTLGSKSSNRASAGLIAGLTVAAVLSISAAVAATFISWRRRQRALRAKGGSAASSSTVQAPLNVTSDAQQGAGESTTPAQSWPSLPDSMHGVPVESSSQVLGGKAPLTQQLPLSPLSTRFAAGAEPEMLEHRVPSAPVATGFTSTNVAVRANSMASSSPGNRRRMPRSGEAITTAHVDSSKRRLQHELILMCDRQEQFMGAYRVLSPVEQREGGQGLVQFMRWAHTEEPVAVKFFLSQATFDEEMQLYAEERLRSMMPVMRDAMRAGEVKSFSGYAFPAFVVLERGESLQDWRRIVQPRITTVVDVRSPPHARCL